MNNFPKPNTSPITSPSSLLQNSSINSQSSEFIEYQIKNQSSHNKQQSDKTIQDVDSMIIEQNVQESFDSEKSTPSFYMPSQSIVINYEKMKNENRQLQELIKTMKNENEELKIKNKFSEKKVKNTEELLEYAKGQLSILQEQNKRSDDKLRNAWADLLANKAKLRGEMEDGETSNEIYLTRTRRRPNARQKDNNSDEFNIITKGFVCEWESCNKVYKTRNHLKAHIVAIHLGDVLDVKIDK